MPLPTVEVTFLSRFDWFFGLLAVVGVPTTFGIFSERVQSSFFRLAF
jgi:hypothetical protein